MLFLAESGLCNPTAQKSIALLGIIQIDSETESASTGSHPAVFKVAALLTLLGDEAMMPQLPAVRPIFQVVPTTSARRQPYNQGQGTDVNTFTSTLSLTFIVYNVYIIMYIYDNPTLSAVPRGLILLSIFAK
jgi:hypothetical protein